MRSHSTNNELLCSNLKVKENDIKKEKEAIKKEEQGRKKRIKTFKDMEEYDFQPNNYKDFISLVKGVLSDRQGCFVVNSFVVWGLCVCVVCVLRLA